jgi:hypothetical protein
VFNADTSFTVGEAANDTDVPVSAVAAIATDRAASITFVDGTATVWGAADVVTFTLPDTVTAKGAALDEVVMNIVLVRAAAVTIAIFLNDFI